MMKRKIRKTFGMILALTLCLNMTAPAAAASAKYNAAVAKYNRFLKSNSGTYKIVDLDKNGIPELIFHNTYTYQNEVYTYNVKTKKKVPLKKIPMGKGYAMDVKYSAAKSQVMIPTANTGGSTIAFYKIKGTKATRVGILEYTNGKHETAGFKVNGKKVTQAVYNKTLKNMSKNFKKLSKVSY